MKSIGILTDMNSDLGVFIENNVMEIFSGYVNVNRYHQEQLETDQVIRDDVLLVMSKERFIEACKYIDDTSKVIIVKRTVREEDIFRILEIPLSSKVLLVNDTKETTLDTLSSLYQIGIRNLNIVPYEEGKAYPDINIAITPGLSRKVPEHIDKIIDIGNRYIDVSTFIEITEMLSLNNKLIKERLIIYSNTIITLDRGIRNSVKELHSKNEELELISNLSNEGGLLINSKNEILRYNSVFAEMFDIKDDLVGSKIELLFNNENLKLMNNKVINQELMSFEAKTFLVSKKKTSYLNETTGYYINFQDITYIKKLEQALSNKIKNKGLIARYNFSDIISESETMKKCINLAKKLALADDTLIITGESGTGKELLAQSIHNESSRSSFPFVVVNCAAISESLLESELFGYEGGSFTGALKQGKPGYFELAHNGTIFLDEIGDMPISLQTRLLRVLQEKQVMRIGSSEVLNIDVRVIVATNKDLKKMIVKGDFRKDLYYRINVLPIELPPLRKRKGDIIPLIDFFMNKENFLMDDAVRQILLEYEWPGNIRELENAASYMKILKSEYLEVDDLPNYLLYKDDEFDNLHTDLTIMDNKNCIYELLSIVKVYTDKNLGVGRNRIEKELNAFGIDISENEIRRIINELNKEGLLISNKGRAGTVVTQRGKKFINWLDNR